MILKKKLTEYEQTQLLSGLFGFHFEGDILIDDDGQEFYGFDKNARFDFTTLEGVFAYAFFRAREQGFADGKLQVQNSIKTALEIY